MTNPNLTEIVVIVDRSSSMTTIKTEMEVAFANFIESHKNQPGDCLLTVAQFDDNYEKVCTAIPINQAKPFALNPRGSTSLWGAIGRTIDELGERLALTEQEKRPGKILFVVITDGQENSSHINEWSREYTKNEVFNRVKHQTEKYSWEFVYIGANQDTIMNAREIGIDANVFNFKADNQGVKSMMDTFTLSSTNYRQHGSYSVTK